WPMRSSALRACQCTCCTDSAPDWLPNTMPYATVLLVLVFLSQNLRMPVAVGQPYRKGGA
ncbi:MAG: hypothetical protein AAGG08_07660, partial [Actinomycetota bacterium]